MYMLLIDGEIKSEKNDEFLKAWSSQIMPLLKKQKGFIDEMLLFESGTNAATGLCFWQTQQDAEQYNREVFPQAKGSVEHLLDGTPTVRGFHVAAAKTFHIVASSAAYG